MLHLLPLETSDAEPAAPAEALARLVGLRRALAAVDPQAQESFDEEELAWKLLGASESVRRCFDAESERLIASVAAGLEALLASSSGVAAPEASNRIAREIHQGLGRLSALLSR